MKTYRQYQIVTPNPEQVVLAQRREEFRQVLNQADLAIPDGIGIAIAMQLLNLKSHPPAGGSNLPPASLREALRAGKATSKNSKLKKFSRVAGADLMLALCRLAAQKGWRVFLLGAREAAALTANKLQLLYPQLQVAFDGGAEDIKNESTSERKRVINKINDFRPHLLFVAYGAPYQELWVAKNLPLLRTKVAMSVGGAFDFLAGKVPRAPKWLQDLGMEWLYRLIRQPWRLKRQVALIKFVWLVITHSP